MVTSISDYAWWSGWKSNTIRKTNHLIFIIRLHFSIPVEIEVGEMVPPCHGIIGLSNQNDIF
jgi:hypothetical protein